MNNETICEIYVKKPGAALRSRVYNKFNNLLLSYAMENSVEYTNEGIDKMAKNLEINIFNASVKSIKDPSFKNQNFVKEYKRRFVHIFVNLDPNGYVNNTNLIFRFLLLKEMTPKELVNGSNEFLFPERYEEYNAEMERIRVCKEKMKEEVTTGTFKCGKCAANKKKNLYNTEHYQLQTRSAKIGQKSIQPSVNRQCREIKQLDTYLELNFECQMLVNAY